MKYLISACMITLCILSTVKKSECVELAKQAAGGQISNIMSNIYKDILKIKDKYKELDEFDEKAYQKNGEIRYGKSKYKYEGQNKPNYIDQLSLVIMPTEWPYPPQPSFPPLDRSEPDREIYIKEIGLYLDIYITTDNSELKSELMKIIEKNANFESKRLF